MKPLPPFAELAAQQQIRFFFSSEENEWASVSCVSGSVLGGQEAEHLQDVPLSSGARGLTGEVRQEGLHSIRSARGSAFKAWGISTALGFPAEVTQQKGQDGIGLKEGRQSKNIPHGVQAFGSRSRQPEEHTEYAEES